MGMAIRPSARHQPLRFPAVFFLDYILFQILVIFLFCFKMFSTFLTINLLKRLLTINKPSDFFFFFIILCR